MRILIAVSQALVRDALRKLLEERGHEIVASAQCGPEAVQLARRCEPDVALLDLGMSRPEIMAAAREISSEVPSTAVVLLAGELRNGDLLEAIGCGARGFLTRDLDGPAFCRMLERAGAGELAITSALASRLIEEITMGTGPKQRTGGCSALTPRETEVLGEMVHGHTSNRDLARLLELSENTIRFHVRNILEKLGQHSRASAVAFALTHGIVEGRKEV